MIAVGLRKHLHDCHYVTAVKPNVKVKRRGSRSSILIHTFSIHGANLHMLHVKGYFLCGCCCTWSSS